MSNEQLRQWIETVFALMGQVTEQDIRYHMLKPHLLALLLIQERRAKGEAA